MERRQVGAATKAIAVRHQDGGAELCARHRNGLRWDIDEALCMAIRRGARARR